MEAVTKALMNLLGQLLILLFEAWIVMLALGGIAELTGWNCALGFRATVLITVAVRVLLTTHPTVRPLR